MRGAAMGRGAQGPNSACRKSAAQGRYGTRVNGAPGLPKPDVGGECFSRVTARPTATRMDELGHLSGPLFYQRLASIRTALPLRLNASASALARGAVLPGRQAEGPRHRLLGRLDGRRHAQVILAARRRV